MQGAECFVALQDDDPRERTANPMQYFEGPTNPLHYSDGHVDAMFNREVARRILLAISCVFQPVGRQKRSKFESKHLTASEIVCTRLG